MLQLKNLGVAIDGKPIVNDLSLTVKAGEIHAIMGPNGSGKSTLASCIMGHPKYTVTSGDIVLDGESVLALKVDKRAQRGIFLAFQYPKEIPGVTVSAFLRTALSSIKKARGETIPTPIEFRKLLRSTLSDLSMDSSFMNRYVNEGFSGGEKKKMEILQMAVLEPRIAILDEADSGLDIDALKTVAEGIRALSSPTRGIVLITHYQRILHYVRPHFIHVMIGGRLVTSGGSELSTRLEKEGYEWLKAAPELITSTL